VDDVCGERRRGHPHADAAGSSRWRGLTVQYGHVTQRTVLFEAHVRLPIELGFALKPRRLPVVAVALLYSRTYLENRRHPAREYYVLALTAAGIFVLGVRQQPA